MLRRLAERAQQEVGTMGVVSLSSLVWALATLGQREGPLLDAVAARAMQLGTQLDAQVRQAPRCGPRGLGALRMRVVGVGKGGGTFSRLLPSLA
jgi:hypothetical protein